MGSQPTRKWFYFSLHKTASNAFNSPHGLSKFSLSFAIFVRLSLQISHNSWTNRLGLILAIRFGFPRVRPLCKQAWPYFTSPARCSPLAASDLADSVQDCGYCIRLHPWLWSSILQRHLHHSGRYLQSNKPPFGPSWWHVRPANQDTARPTKLPCCSSNCLDQSSSSSALAIYQSRTIQRWVENPSRQSSLCLPPRTF